MSKKSHRLTRRELMKLGAATGAASVFTKAWARTCPTDRPPVPIGTVANTGCPIDADLYPTSPFILNPFTEPLPVPTALKPGYRNPDGALSAGGSQDWMVRVRNGRSYSGPCAPGPNPGNQDALGERPMPNDGNSFQFVDNRGNIRVQTMNYGGARAGTHQLYPGGRGTSYPRLAGQAKTAFDLLAADPIRYHIRLQVAEHTFTNSDVQPIDAKGNVLAALPPGAPVIRGAAAGTFKMPASTIYGYNGTFPGPMINFEYGRPAIVRFENDLDDNPACLDRMDFGAPDWAFLTHLHNGHTAPECDGQPHHLMENEGGYTPGQWSDNLYLGYAAGGLDSEKQSFLWFHDHRMHHTGPNVYKGMVGLMPHYDPASPNNPTGIDSGDETTGLRLPGVRVDNPDGTFDVKYDIPLALYDVRFENGLTPHMDAHTPAADCALTHPEWWGRHFLKHYPNHGFVGDVFTVNCKAYPVLNVERRRYRLRFLGASLARQYELSFRQGTVQPARGRQGQWSFGSARKDGRIVYDMGTQVMRMTQIASEGGLLPNPVLRDSIEIWPAKRREVVVDFSQYQDGSPTRPGDVVYLTNTAEMLDGRQITSRGKWAVPLMKIVIGNLPAVPDRSDPGLTARAGAFNPDKALRARVPAPLLAKNMDFTLQRGGNAGGETEWLINGLQFDPTRPLWAPTLNSFESWGINNGGGGWTHPMHIHMEEHQVVARSSGLGIGGGPPHPEDPIGKEDVVGLEPSEQTTIYRGFRTFLGNYVAHCHNLAHEDHNMMFGWAITL